MTASRNVLGSVEKLMRVFRRRSDRDVVTKVLLLPQQYDRQT